MSRMIASFPETVDSLGRPIHLVHGGKKFHRSTYKCWIDMKSRCFNPKHADFHDYGARGITLCERWLLFENFFADMGEKPKGMSIDRKNNNGNYEPSNCKWATQEEQQNNRRDCVFVSHSGKTQTVAQWARELGVSQSGLRARLNRGMSIQEALTSKRYSKWSRQKNA